MVPVTTVSGVAETMMLSCLVAVVPELSFTWAVKLAVPAVVGVPVMLPSVASESPAGKAPEITDHMLPPLPPLAARVC